MLVVPCKGWHGFRRCQTLRSGASMGMGGAVHGGGTQGLAWVWEVLKLAVAGAVRPPRQLPPVLFYDELNAVPGDVWLGFQAALVAQDRRAAAFHRADMQIAGPSPAHEHQVQTAPAQA